MNLRLPIVLFALLAFAQSCFLLPAAADPGVPVAQAAAALRHDSVAPQTCPANVQGMSLAQIAQTECCKGKKGICGCRAGKLVCCDGSASTAPGCTCHGDEGFTD